MALEYIPTKLVDKMNKEKMIKDNIVPLSIEIDENVIYFISADHPNKKFSLTKAQIRDIFASL
jgi:hypothetical protein